MAKQQRKGALSDRAAAQHEDAARKWHASKVRKLHRGASFTFERGSNMPHGPAKKTRIPASRATIRTSNIESDDQKLVHVDPEFFQLS
jgi:hypothetical protein